MGSEGVRGARGAAEELAEELARLNAPQLQLGRRDLDEADVVVAAPEVALRGAAAERVERQHAGQGGVAAVPLLRKHPRLIGRQAQVAQGPRRVLGRLVRRRCEVRVVHVRALEPRRVLPELGRRCVHTGRGGTRGGMPRSRRRCAWT